jgi:hypothetical protein
MAARVQVKGWGDTVNPPQLSSKQWNLTSLLGVVLIVMAILQIIGFSDFKDWLDNVGFGSTTVWAVVLIIAEVWAALGFFKLKLMRGFRLISGWLAIFVAGFWFIENLRLVSEAKSGEVASSGFFGNFLNQSPGWWTVIEVMIFLFWVIYALRLTWSED